VSGGGTAAYRDLIAGAADRHGVDPALVRAVMAAESGGNPQARSPVGAMGLMQLMPGTAKDLGVANAYDPAQNVEGGTKYLARLTEKFGVERGVAAYNAGPGAVEKYGGVPPYRETRGYVDRVMKLYNQFNEEAP
jgi:soluble lytic murein transglycosylase-like protein